MMQELHKLKTVEQRRKVETLKQFAYKKLILQKN